MNAALEASLGFFGYQILGAYFTQNPAVREDPKGDPKRDQNRESEYPRSGNWVGAIIAAPFMAITIGKTLGTYEIVALLG